jgi:hypothetical protein
LSFNMSGAAIGGIVPEGKVTIGIAPPNSAQIEVKNVHLPNGTLLTLDNLGEKVASFQITSGQYKGTVAVNRPVGTNPTGYYVVGPTGAILMMGHF